MYFNGEAFLPPPPSLRNGGMIWCLYGYNTTYSGVLNSFIRDSARDDD